ncbi:hypothetical protein niasHT_021119 [Heterodera trifolii]|uniref:Uncharacterized protein n=1 Tax=Heterodera trifolii TaxID=157864 RepID=A0ABD2JEX6_9BILA
MNYELQVKRNGFSRCMFVELAFRALKRWKWWSRSENEDRMLVPMVRALEGRVEKWKGGIDAHKQHKGRKGAMEGSGKGTHPPDHRLHPFPSNQATTNVV